MIISSENSDYNAQPLTVTLSATQLMDCVQVVLFNDGDLETDEEFMLTLTASTGATVTPGLDSAQVNITDDEQGKLISNSYMLVHTQNFCRMSWCD